MRSRLDIFRSSEENTLIISWARLFLQKVSTTTVSTVTMDNLNIDSGKVFEWGVWSKLCCLASVSLIRLFFQNFLVVLDFQSRSSYMQVHALSLSCVASSPSEDGFYSLASFLFFFFFKPKVQRIGRGKIPVN